MISPYNFLIFHNADNQKGMGSILYSKVSKETQIKATTIYFEWIKLCNSFSLKINSISILKLISDSSLLSFPICIQNLTELAHPVSVIETQAFL